MREKDYLETIPEDLQERYYEGANQIDLGKFAEGKQLLTELIKENSRFVPAYNKLAVISLYEKNLSEADKYLKKVLEIDQEYVPAITNLGSLKKEMGDVKGAKEYYHRAINIDPEYGPAYNNLGVIYREEGNFKEAVKHLKKAARLSSYYTRKQHEPITKKPGCLIAIILLIGFIVILATR